MSIDLAGTMTKAQEQTLDALKQTQEFSLRAFESALGLLPSDPTFGIAGSIPTPKDAIEASFGFAGRLLEQQKEYALKLAELAARGGTRSGD